MYKTMFKKSSFAKHSKLIKSNANIRILLFMTIYQSLHALMYNKNNNVSNETVTLSLI